ncbi:MAG: response regulator [Verrucomicrobiota bacterium]
MLQDISELLTPRILVVDDESQVHASLRLRLGHQHEVIYCFDGVDALDKIRGCQFDLCITDIHMPKLTGLKFIELAQSFDPCLGFVILSAFDSQENLRKLIPLQVYDFIPKPLPARAELEGRLPDWIRRTRRRRTESGLAAQSAEIAAETHAALLERDVELVASQTARDALSQTASFLTTIHAHLATAASTVAARVRLDPHLSLLSRSLEEARKTAAAATTAAESFFSSAYASRDSSPALVGEGLRHAIEIALRSSGAEHSQKSIDFSLPRERYEVKNLSGIEFLLLVVPAVLAAIELAAPGTTISIRLSTFDRMEVIFRDPTVRDKHWINRKGARSSHAGVAITISAAGQSLSRPEIDAWLKGQYAPFCTIAARGLVNGIQKAHGLLGVSTRPESDQFSLILALPS